MDDNLDDGDVVVHVVVGPTISADARFVGLLFNASVVVVDNDQWGVSVVSPVPAFVVEPNVTMTVAVSLASRPDGPVNVTVVADPGDVAAVVSAMPLRFEAVAWNVTQTVVVAPVDDVFANGVRWFGLEVSAVPSLAGDIYAHAPPWSESLTGMVAIDDVTLAPVQVAPIVGYAGEDGSTATFAFALSGAPVSNVSLSLFTTHADLFVSPWEANFSPSTWSVPVFVTASAADDDLDDGDVMASVDLWAVSGLGPLNGTIVLSSPMLIVDDDESGIMASWEGGLATGTVSELGASTRLFVRLAVRPVGTVALAVRVDDPTEATVTPASLTFTAANWNVDRMVTVTGVKDRDNDGDTSFAVVLTVAPATTDAAFLTLPGLAATAVNTHIDFPVLREARPAVSALLGLSEVVIHGEWFLPNATVLFGTNASSVVVPSAASSNGRTFNRLTVTTPAQAETGYYMVTVINPDGGRATADLGFFYTDDCPFEGQWGRGLTCHDCPEGAQHGCRVLAVSLRRVGGGFVLCHLRFHLLYLARVIFHPSTASDPPLFVFLQTCRRRLPRWFSPLAADRMVERW